MEGGSLSTCDLTAIHSWSCLDTSFSFCRLCGLQGQKLSLDLQSGVLLTSASLALLGFCATCLNLLRFSVSNMGLAPDRELF